MKLINIKCDYCDNEYQKEHKKVRYNAKNGHANYCCMECQRKGKARKEGSIFTECFSCGVPIIVTIAQSKRSKSGNNFCSRSCATKVNNSIYRQGVKHPNYVDGASSYRDVAFCAYEHKCIVCGYDVEIVLEVHHKDKNRSNSDVSNLAILCPTHHREVHAGILSIAK